MDEFAVSSTQAKEQRGASVVALATKRGIDVLLSLTLLVLLSPILLLIAVAIKIDDPGPVSYKRRLVGFEGRPFTAYKFRSMVSDAHDLLRQNAELMRQYQLTLKIVKDPRVTRVGRILRKTSLDELPQLFNVLRGDMSLVGPRMLGDIELERYGSYQERVLSVKPGITGLWQVSGRHAVSFERRIELDLEYVDHWSLGLDVKILLMTIPAVLTGRGAT